MIWKKRVEINHLNQLCKNTMCEAIGIEFTEIGPDFLVATMPVDHRTVQPMRLLHGGASVALAETLGSIASALCIEDDKAPVGIEINANHIKSAHSGLVRGKVTQLKLGQRLHVWNITITNDKAELICSSRLTVMIVDKK